MLGIPVFLRFLVGILVVQAATVVLAVVALRHPGLDLKLAVAILGLLTAFLAAFWFTGLAGRARQQVAARLQARFSREREKLQARAEREKEKAVRQSERTLKKERARERRKTNTRAALLFGALLLTGGFMMLTQFMTLGLLLVSGTGGAVAGYLARGRRQAASRDLVVQEKNGSLVSEEPWQR